MILTIIKKIGNTTLFIFFIFSKMIELEKAFSEYRKFMIKKWSPEKSIRKYYIQIRKAFIFNKKTGENRNSISEKEIERYIKSNKHRVKSTIYSETMQIKSFLKFCNIHWYCNLDSRKIIAPRRDFIEAKFLKKEDINKILNKIENYNIKIKTAILLLLTTGTRISEACSITKKHLQKAILVNNNFQINIIWKRKKVRSIFIPTKIYELCTKNQLLHWEENVIWLNCAQLSRNIRKIRKELKMNFTAHTFRHTYITELAKKGASLYLIQKLAWHSNINTTAHYLHSYDEELSKTAELANFWI